MKNQIESGRNIPNILVVDDVPANLKFLDDILKHKGYKTRPVLSGELALRAAEKEKPDMILLDIMMPGIDGFEVCRRLKENPGLKDIPVIFISAMGETANVVKAFAVGGVDYINKPFQAEEILARVATHLENCWQKKELERLNSEKDKFFSIIAHDLRSPLSGLMTLSEIMAHDSGDLSPELKKEMMQDLRNTARNTFNLLSNLLEWSRMQRGYIEFNPQVFGLKALITDNFTIAADLARNKSITLINEIPDEQEVFADFNMLQTIFRNLTSNAIKFTPTDGKVTISSSPGKSNSVEITVKDSGIGMSADLLSNLFRLGASTRRPGTEGEPSTGLGLILCKEFIEKHGGKIWAESAPGEGSMFVFTLPGT